MDWYEYGYRNYDPQIGRFVQLDPLTFNFPFLTPYQYASNDPVTNIDVDGLEGMAPVPVLGHIDGAVVTPASTMEGVTVVSFITTKTAGPASNISEKALRQFARSTAEAMKIKSDNSIVRPSIRPPLGSNRISANQSNFIDRFLEALDKFAMGKGGGNLGGGIALMKDAKEGEKNLKLDVSGMTADYVDVLNHADKFLEFLGGAGDSEKGLAEIVASNSYSKAERAIAAIGLFKQAWNDGDKLSGGIPVDDFWDKGFDNLIEKFEDGSKNYKEFMIETFSHQDQMDTFGKSQYISPNYGDSLFYFNPKEGRGGRFKPDTAKVIIFKHPKPKNNK